MEENKYTEQKANLLAKHLQHELDSIGLINLIIEARKQRDEYKNKVDELKMYKTQLNRINIRLIQLKDLQKELSNMTLIE